MTGRIFRAIAATAFLLAMSAGAVSAGGWATITADPGNGEPTAGEPTTLGFTVLQHGVTPAGWESPTLVVTDSATGERIEAAASSQGPDGHFVATVTLPRAGYWTWHVELRDLLVETTPQPLLVAFADGSAPLMDAASMLAAIERGRVELRAELQAQAGAELDGLRVQISSLSSQLGAARAESQELAGEVEQLRAGGVLPAEAPGVPLLALLGISGLTGALAGFIVARLARPTPIPAAAPVEEAAPAGRLATP